MTDIEDQKGMRPSGFMAILYFTKKVTTYKSLDIIGFDFFRKITDVYRKTYSLPFSWYLPIRDANKGDIHNKNIEHDYVSKLEKQKKLNWNVFLI